jgi:hypothetical protein
MLTKITSKIEWKIKQTKQTKIDIIIKLGYCFLKVCVR